MRPTRFELQAAGATQSLTQWGLLYSFALVLILMLWVGSVYGALSAIGVMELVAVLWMLERSRNASSIGPPVPRSWELPIRAIQWYGILAGCWSLAGFVVVWTLIWALIMFFARPQALGPANLAAAVLVGGWLLTRPLWHPPLMRWVTQALQQVTQEAAGPQPEATVAGDGIDIDFAVQRIGSAQQQRSVVHVPFPELDEVRALGQAEAKAYWQSMQAYDPRLSDRVSYEFAQYMQGRLPRPSIFYGVAVETALLLRGSSVLYLLSGDGGSGSAVAAAWEAWRSAHVAPKA